MIERSADRGGEVFYPQLSGLTALHSAAGLGDPGIMRSVILVARTEHHGAEPPVMASPTPLHRAAIDGHVEVSALLVEYGLDIHQIDRWGHSPVVIACMQRWRAADIRQAFGAGPDELCPKGEVEPLHYDHLPFPRDPHSGWLGSSNSAKKASDLNQGVHPEHPCEIDVRYNLTAEGLATDYLSISRPVLLRGLQVGRSWDILRTKWRRDSLAETLHVC